MFAHDCLICSAVESALDSALVTVGNMNAHSVLLSLVLQCYRRCYGVLVGVIVLSPEQSRNYIRKPVRVRDDALGVRDEGGRHRHLERTVLTEVPGAGDAQPRIQPRDFGAEVEDEAELPRVGVSWVAQLRGPREAGFGSHHRGLFRSLRRDGNDRISCTVQFSAELLALRLPHPLQRW